ncbi:Nitrous oxide reductase maturation protein NosD [hydrothermal vent metagenome]|uniref:Nitrous oxide reductase maturation protein NosD n=1 Tax=hydrothermal vent metagenome TaxID=652676 RepID=A0A3B0U6L8_9ZZZZ
MLLRTLLTLFVLLLPATLAGAVEWRVEPGGQELVITLQKAQAGDILRLLPGTHMGPISVEMSLTIAGNGQANIKGNGTGSVISVMAPNVTLKGLTISGSGSAGQTKDAGITLGQNATNAIVINNTLIGNLIGVNLQGVKNALVKNNIIEGRQDHRMNDRGNGIYLWNSPGSRIIGNDIRWGRDGIFANVSNENEFSGNRFRDLRFAVHYMYVHDSLVSNNVSLGNHLGYAIMNSKNVRVEGNLSRGDRDHGIMMNYTNNSEILGNRIERVNEKCLFIYNSHKNNFAGNLFSGCGIGVHFTAGSERNKFSGNGFVGNRVQVQYAGTRWIDWSENGLGNYWSDHPGFDLNGDGIADAPYRPNDAMDQVLWRQPAAKLLLGSPAVQLIRWSQSAFPALLPGGVMDSAPLMLPVEPEIPPWKETQ